MEPCFEYFGCNNKNCLMNGRLDGTYCWDVEGTLCNHHAIKIIREKLDVKKKEACARSGCIYITAAKERNLV